MEHIIQEGETIGNIIAGQTQLWNYALSYLESMSVKCAIELGIPDAIHNHSQPITIAELIPALSIPASKASGLRRLMRFLSCIGFFSATGEGPDKDTIYSLTAASKLVVKGSSNSQAAFMLLQPDRVLMESSWFMSAWFRSGGGEPNPFQVAHGQSIWDLASKNPRFNELFNEATSADSRLLMEVLTKERSHVFQGIRSLVDVGGGTGATARTIAKAFPEVKCIVLELPHVVDTVTEKATINFVAGDMFTYIPRADAVLLKWVMHICGDDDCVRILQRCKEAIPTKEDGGKVVIIDTVVDANNPHQSSKAQLYLDMLMMVNAGGLEREEHEWRNIFNRAGFSSYKIYRATDTRSVIEVYP